MLERSLSTNRWGWRGVDAYRSRSVVAGSLQSMKAKLTDPSRPFPARHAEEREDSSIPALKSWDDWGDLVSKTEQQDTNFDQERILLFLVQTCDFSNTMGN